MSKKMRGLNNIIECSEKHKERFIEIFSQAFFEDPLFIAVFKDPEFRRKKLIPFFDEAFRYGLKFGRIYASSENLEGMIVCLPPNNTYRNFLKEIKVINLKIFLQIFWIYLKIWNNVDKCHGSAHKRHAPFNHFYIMSFAIDPKFQRRGYGSALMQYIIKVVNKSNLPIYLETQNEKNLSFYEKFDFEVLEEEIIQKLDVKTWYLLKKY
ncbi:MAG: GNAT family N-acetyltransferase [Promethearchaeota archaeon]|nr:MAG: GNAT family N-acetyltransferase [Candidatus Lokiarchaeota archaeon]